MGGAAMHGVLANTDDLTIRAEAAQTIIGKVFWPDGAAC